MTSTTMVQDIVLNTTMVMTPTQVTMVQTTARLLETTVEVMVVQRNTVVSKVTLAHLENMAHQVITVVVTGVHIQTLMSVTVVHLQITILVTVLHLQNMVIATEVHSLAMTQPPRVVLNINMTVTIISKALTTMVAMTDMVMVDTVRGNIQVMADILIDSPVIYQVIFTEPYSTDIVSWTCSVVQGQTALGVYICTTETVYYCTI